MSKRMTAQTKPHLFNAFDPINIVAFYCSFTLAYVSSAAYEGVAMRILHFLMKKSFSSALHRRLASKHNAKKRVTFTGKTTTLTTYLQNLDHLLRTFATDETIEDTEDEKSKVSSMTQQNSVAVH